MSAMRAKFKINKVTTHHENFEELEFAAVTEKPFDAEGKSEDNDFARWTPNGSLKMSITNSNLVGRFKEGQAFYLDFTPAESASAD